MKHEQIENDLRRELEIKPKSHKFVKKLKLRDERRKAKLNPETPPTYRKYCGWEF